MLNETNIQEPVVPQQPRTTKIGFSGKTGARRGKTLPMRTVLPAHSRPHDMLAQGMGVLASATTGEGPFSAIVKSSSLELGHLDLIPAMLLTSCVTKQASYVNAQLCLSFFPSKMNRTIPMPL